MTEKHRDPPSPALDPRASVVIEACAGSGKTWMLVSRIVRLLLGGAAPSHILAITFTRKAAQEMATRLRDWLYELATASDDDVRKFLRDRAVAEREIEALLPVARQLYERFLTAQPSVTITTFHSWFLQLLRRAPLDAGALGEVNLAEQTSALVDEAWQLFASGLQREADSPARRGLEQLFRDCGLDNTRRLLTRFLYHRAEWWAHVRGRPDPVAHALGLMREEMGVDPDSDVPSALFSDSGFVRELGEYAVYLERNTPRDQGYAQKLSAAQPEPASLFKAARGVVLTSNGDGPPRALKASGAQAKRLTPQGETRFLELHAKLAARLIEARDQLIDQRSYRFNEAALHCGVALLDAYQRVKADRQVIDYADIEWNAWQLVSVSDHALYMHYKLDARYRHILLDEFQDTNPLQWLTLKSWLEAAAAADLRPTVFMVGDPKQSIYRFRRAEARLFAQAADYLQEAFQAGRLPQDETRRCPAPVVEVVNRLFAAEDFEGFETHVAHFAGKEGCVEVLPLVAAARGGPAAGADRLLRNPLTERLEVEEDRRREDEARQLVDGIRAIHGRWQVSDDPKGAGSRPADYHDIMILVRRRTHLAIYERALRQAGIPFVTSRQGGLLDTLEARDIVALLEFLVSPFADLQLAHALRSPLFACPDEDLMALARAGDGRTWWERLQLVAAQGCSPALRRAHELLARWLQRTDSAPVHDQLDRIYFEADVLHRYDQSVPKAMRDTVRANLQALMQRALDIDSGRYPSLPRFLHELMDLREAPPEEAPDEGIVGDAGNAVRIYTVHGAKGLEAPIVWLLDSAAGQDAGRGYDALIDWPPEAPAPRRFSLYARAKEQSAAQRAVADAEEALAERENLNMLYVAMTRSQQALIVSGCEGRGRAGSWYEKVRAAVHAAAGTDADDATAVARLGDDLGAAAQGLVKPKPERAAAAAPDPRLSEPLPTGERRQLPSGRGMEYGVRFHALMERLTAAAPAGREAIERDLGVPGREFTAMWEQAQRVMSAHARFFDARQFRRAVNEISYISASGEVRRIDRLVEREDAVWVLDYKTGEPKADAALLPQYRAQLAEYRDAMRLAYGADRRVHAAMLFTDGSAVTLED